jgi:hypothetical protein
MRFAIALVLLVSGCSPAHNGCETDADCAAPYTCIDGAGGCVENPDGSCTLQDICGDACPYGMPGADDACPAGMACAFYGICRVP